MLDNSWLKISAKLVDVVAGEIFGSLMILSKRNWLPRTAN